VRSENKFTESERSCSLPTRAHSDEIISLCLIVQLRNFVTVLFPQQLLAILDEWNC